MVPFIPFPLVTVNNTHCAMNTQQWSLEDIGCKDMNQTELIWSMVE